MDGALSNFGTRSWQFSVGRVLIKQTSKCRKLLNKQTKPETERKKKQASFSVKKTFDGSS
jgi:hypothetical protein